MIYLASQSPRRAELLHQIGIAFDVLHVDVDESVHPGESPEAYVRRVSQDKARAGLALHPGNLVLGSDTAVILDQTILGKPSDKTHATEMLLNLSGREHRVLTGVALTGSEEQYRLSESRVRFRTIQPAEAEAYWNTGEPADKAGGYAIQGIGALFIESLEGSFSGVMGLPIYETGQMLEQAGISPLGAGGQLA